MKKRNLLRNFYFTHSDANEDSSPSNCGAETTETSSPPTKEIVKASNTSRSLKSCNVELAEDETPASLRRCGNASHTSQPNESASRSSSATSRGRRNLKWRHVLTHLIYRQLLCRIEDVPATKLKHVFSHKTKRRGLGLAFEMLQARITSWPELPLCPSFPSPTSRPCRGGCGGR